MWIHSCWQIEAKSFKHTGSKGVALSHIEQGYPPAEASRLLLGCPSIGRSSRHPRLRSCRWVSSPAPRPASAAQSSCAVTAPTATGHHDRAKLLRRSHDHLLCCPMEPVPYKTQAEPPPGLRSSCAGGGPSAPDALRLPPPCHMA